MLHESVLRVMKMNLRVKKDEENRREESEVLWKSCKLVQCKPYRYWFCWSPLRASYNFKSLFCYYVFLLQVNKIEHSIPSLLKWWTTTKDRHLPVNERGKSTKRGLMISIETSILKYDQHARMWQRFIPMNYSTISIEQECQVMYSETLKLQR